ncbi:MAG: hypothetical protein Q8L15_18490 [Methylobacter sp.]|nr:hypothetical protein [Methylobacter sp.]
MSNDLDFYMNNPEQFEQLTEDQQAALFNGGTVDQGDTSEADSSDDANEETSAAPEPSEEKTEPSVMAKDGVHTIPYQELLDARNKAAEWEAIVSQQAQLIADLQQAKADDAGTGSTTAQDAVLEAYQGDFPEVADDLKPLIQAMIDQGVKAGIEQFQQKIDAMVAPAQKLVVENDLAAHFDAIRSAHSDFEDVFQSGKLHEWVNKQPSFVRDQYTAVMDRGNAAQAIELLSAYKDTNGLSAAAIESSATDKAKDIIAAVKPKVPGSLSDIPSGTIGSHDETSAILNMSSRDLEAKFANKSPEEIMKLMSKIV